MGKRDWRSGGSEGTTQRITRRSILASIGTGAIGGIAGCTGGGDEGGGSGQTTTLPEEVEEEMPTTAGSQSDTLIPGEIVYQGLSGIEVLDHWAEQDQNDWVKLEIQNNRDEPFKRPADYQSNTDADIIRGRTLTEQGNILAGDVWVTRTNFGPGEIKPGTSAIIGLDCAPATQNAARYELCLHKKANMGSIKDWKIACTDWTPTPTATPTPGPGPGSNEVIHNGLDNVEVLGHEMTDADREGWINAEVELKNNGEYIKRFYVAVQFYDQWGRYYPPREPAFIWAHKADTVGQYKGLEAGETLTVKVPVRIPEGDAEIESYEVCVGQTNNELTAEKIITACEWPRDG